MDIISELKGDSNIIKAIDIGGRQMSAPIIFV